MNLALRVCALTWPATTQIFSAFQTLLAERAGRPIARRLEVKTATAMGPIRHGSNRCAVPTRVQTIWGPRLAKWNGYATRLLDWFRTWTTRWNGWMNFASYGIPTKWGTKTRAILSLFLTIVPVRVLVPASPGRQLVSKRWSARLHSVCHDYSWTPRNGTALYHQYLIGTGCAL